MADSAGAPGGLDTAGQQVDYPDLEESVARLLFPDADQKPGTAEPAESSEPGTAPETAEQAETPAVGTLLKDALPKGTEFWSMQVAVGDDGETASIEQLKDAYTHRKRTDRDIADLERRQSDWRADEYRQRRDLQTAIQALQQPGGLNRDNVERIQAFNRAWTEREQSLVKQVMPDALSEQAQELLARHAAKFGASQQEVAQVREAAGWVQLIMHDWAAMQARRAELASKASKPQPKQQQPQAGKPKRPSAMDAARRGEISHEQAVERLLFGS